MTHMMFQNFYLFLLNETFCTHYRRYIRCPSISQLPIITYVWLQIFNGFFLIECVCKVFAFGFFMGPNTFLRNPWNWLDFVVVVFGTMELFDPNGPTFSMFRAFRLLRVVTKVPQLKFLVSVIFKSVPALLDVFSLCAFVLFVFGIVGVMFFGSGVLRGACYDIDSGAQINGNWPCAMGQQTNDDPIQDLYFCAAGTQECLPLNLPPYNTISFDNIIYALINIFQVFSQQGWTDILYNLQSCFSFQVWIYFVALNFIGPYFLIQLFLVVLAQKYAELSSAAKFAAASTPSLPKHSPRVPVNEGTDDGPSADFQEPGVLEGKRSPRPAEQPISILEVAGTSPRPSSPSLAKEAHSDDREDTAPGVGSRWEVGLRLIRRARGVIQTVAVSRFLEYLIVAAIVINTCFMAIDADCDFCADGTCARFKGGLELSNLGFTAIFTFEATVNFLAFGLYRYCWVMAPMSWLDIIIVVSSLAEVPSILSTSACYLHQGVPCSSYDYCEAGGAVSVLRVIRLLRILKLLRRFKSLQKQVMAIVKTLKMVAWLLALIGLFTLVFVILGMTEMPGMVIQPYSTSNLVPGMRVFVTLPGDSLGDISLLPTLQGSRPGTIDKYPDFANHSARPWLHRARF